MKTTDFNYRLIVKVGRKVYSDIVYTTYQEAVSGGEYFLGCLEKLFSSDELKEMLLIVKFQILPVKR